MSLPLTFPVAPMLAKAVDTIPEPGPAGMQYEPKWDGFRCVVFQDGTKVRLGSRSNKELTRYFPEIVEAFAQDSTRRVLDGELVVAVGDRLDWDALSARIHPATSRIDHLAQTTPAMFVAFDLLALDDEDLTSAPFRRRRVLLDDLALPGSALARTRATLDPAQARSWFGLFEGAGLDGIVAKPLDAPYQPGRRAMLKVKHRRTADVVVIGYRLHKQSTAETPLVGSLLLGLDGPDGLVQVGGAAAFSAAQRAALIEELAPWVSGHDHGQASRWRAGRDSGFVTLRPERVAEVAYDQLEMGRFRHTVTFLRWRPDRDPASCTTDQLEVPTTYSLADVLAP